MLRVVRPDSKAKSTTDKLKFGLQTGRTAPLISTPRVGTIELAATRSMLSTEKSKSTLRSSADLKTVLRVVSGVENKNIERAGPNGFRPSVRETMASGTKNNRAAKRPTNVGMRTAKLNMRKFQKSQGSSGIKKYTELIRQPGAKRLKATGRSETISAGKFKENSAIFIWGCLGEGAGRIKPKEVGGNLNKEIPCVRKDVPTKLRKKRLIVKLEDSTDDKPKETRTRAFLRRLKRRKRRKASDGSNHYSVANKSLRGRAVGLRLAVRDF